SIVDLGLPEDSLVVLIARGERYIVPSGSSILEGGDILLVLVNSKNLPVIRETLSKQKRE
ncbi:MAG: potassium/proton antiporter, partial [Ignavibacteriales bacterium]|nr:potassium/proton antiporter [Ignavibacteriales bacterium]